MTGLLTYAAIGILFLFLSALVFRRSQVGGSTAIPPESDHVRGLCDEGFLTLGDRIFDPNDCHWLRDDLALPHLARALSHSRRRLALRWLMALRADFDKRVPTFHNASSKDLLRWPAPCGYFVRGTILFYIVWAYAWSVVFIFGPGRRLIPSFDWAHFIPSFIPRRSPHDAVGPPPLR
jgi:hypothetical protein